MHTITFYPIGNADTTRIDLARGGKILVDYADLRCADDASDKRIDLAAALREDLRKAKRDYYDIVAFTHLDRDHICGSSDFFHFDHVDKYQGNERIRVRELWVPAAAILETGVKEDARVIREEAKYRLRKGEGIRVFSSPGLLNDWLRDNGINPEDRRHLISDAGTLVPDFGLYENGVEFFVHSPFATRSEDGELLNRNKDSLCLQATFHSDGTTTRLHLFADVTHDVIADIVNITEYHAQYDDVRSDRLRWDIFKLPHHSSYVSLGPEKGTARTEPVPAVQRLYEKYGQRGGILVSTSKPVHPDTDDDPPHRQAAQYYQSVARSLGGQYVVTMEHPSKAKPRPLVIQIDGRGGTIKKELTGGVGPIVSNPAPRAGSR